MNTKLNVTILKREHELMNEHIKKWIHFKNEIVMKQMKKLETHILITKITINMKTKIKQTQTNIHKQLIIDTNDVDIKHNNNWTTH